MTPLEEQVEKAIEAAELALDAQMDVFLNHDNPFGFETFSPYKAAKIAIEAALAVLTQPQSEEKKFIRQGADGSTEFVSTSGGGAATEECDCPSLLDCRENAGAIPADCAYAALMEGGAATPRGVADADLEGEGVYEAVYACLDACGGTMGSTVLHFLADLDERGFRVVRADTEPSPYAKAFRERFPVPEFPGIEKEES